MMPAANTSMTEQFAYAQARRIPYLVVFDIDDLMMNATVKVKQIHGGKFEQECHAGDLVRVLSSQLSVHGHGDHGGHHARHVAGGIQMTRTHSSEELGELLAANGGAGNSGIKASPVTGRFRR